MSTLERIERYAGVARKSRGIKRKDALREMKIAVLEFLRDERKHSVHPPTANANR
jgi:hypothetical protein